MARQRGAATRTSGIHPIHGDLADELREFLEEHPLQAPAAHVAVVALEQRREVVRLGGRVVAVRLVEAERPAESEVPPVVHAELVGCEVVVVVSDEAVAERGPGEEVDGDGVAADLLGMAVRVRWAQLLKNLGEFTQVFARGAFFLGSVFLR
jgi:hypothetical protein